MHKSFYDETYLIFCKFWFVRLVHKFVSNEHVISSRKFIERIRTNTNGQRLYGRFKNENKSNNFISNEHHSKPNDLNAKEHQTRKHEHIFQIRIQLQSVLGLRIQLKQLVQKYFNFPKKIHNDNSLHSES